MSRLSSCGTTPRRARIRGPSTAGSSPSTRSSPPVTGDTHPIMRMVDVLPAPFGPRKPNASPGSTWKSMPSTATKSPKCLVRFVPWIRGPAAASDTKVDATGFPSPHGPTSSAPRCAVGALAEPHDLVDRAEVRARRRLDDVGRRRRGPTPCSPSTSSWITTSPSASPPLGHRRHLEVEHRARDPGGLRDGLDGGVDHAVARAVGLDLAVAVG